MPEPQGEKQEYEERCLDPDCPECNYDGPEVPFRGLDAVLERYVSVDREDLRSLLDCTEEWWADQAAQGEEPGLAAERLKEALG